MNYTRKPLAFASAILLALALPLSPVLAAYNGVVHYGQGNAPLGQIIATGAPGTLGQITGTTGETVLANVLIPAGFVPANSRIIVRTFWNFTGTAGTKTTKVYLNSAATAGGTAYLTAAGAAGDLSAMYETTIFVAGATNAQSGGLPTGAFGRSTAAVLPTGTIDMTANSYIVISVTNASAADTSQLAGYQVEILQQ